MDLLSSLGLDNSLPEQSSRLTSHPGIIKALESGDSDVRLGFNACLHCGSKILLDENDDCRDGTTTASKKKSKKSSGNGGKGYYSCKGCKRVKYCSPACRKADAEEDASSQQYNADDDDDDDEGETSAIGHSPVICALLNLCNDDDDAEERFYKEQTARSDEPKTTGDESTTDPKKEAASYRVRTEFESYPAALFNMLSEGPDWYVEAITRRLRCENQNNVRSPEPKKMRRGKRDRNSISPSKQQQRQLVEEGGGNKRRELVLHVVGASVDSELWYWEGKTTNGNDDDDNVPSVLKAYAEASTNLASYLKSLLELPSVSVRCVFVGPDCPPKHCKVTVPIPDSESTITLETRKCDYGDAEQPYLPAPDAIAFFNPGFSCTDYDWSGALAAAAAYQPSSSPGAATPFLITTNTEMEGFADVKCLLDGGYVDAKDLPGDILEAVDHPPPNNANDEDDDDDEERCKFFFGENPYAGLRVRQSGTMGNDLYVKSRWIMGGLFQSSGGGSGAAVSLAKKRSNDNNKSTTEEDDHDGEGKKKKRKKQGSGERTGGGKNSKRKNPALI